MVIWAGAGAVIITVGAAAEAIITAGGTGIDGSCSGPPELAARFRSMPMERLAASWVCSALLTPGGNPK